MVDLTGGTYGQTGAIAAVLIRYGVSFKFNGTELIADNVEFRLVPSVIRERILHVAQGAKKERHTHRRTVPTRRRGASTSKKDRHTG